MAAFACPPYSGITALYSSLLYYNRAELSLTRRPKGEGGAEKTITRNPIVAGELSTTVSGSSKAEQKPRRSATFSGILPVHPDLAADAKRMDDESETRDAVERETAQQQCQELVLAEVLPGSVPETTYQPPEGEETPLAKDGEEEKDGKDEGEEEDEEMTNEEACAYRLSKPHLLPLKFLFEQYGEWDEENPDPARNLRKVCHPPLSFTRRPADPSLPRDRAEMLLLGGEVLHWTAVVYHPQNPS